MSSSKPVAVQDQMFYLHQCQKAETHSKVKESYMEKEDGSALKL